MSTTEIRIAGFGGQGIILAGLIIGKTAVVYENKHSTLIQSFGPEARGSACSAQVIISDEKILYPYVRHPDILICMSQDAYNRFAGYIKRNGILIVEEELVKVEQRQEVKIYRIPSTRIAEEVASKISSNMVMLGFFTAVTKLLNPESVKKAISTSIPSHTIKFNLEAFDRGFAYYKG